MTASLPSGTYGRPPSRVLRQCPENCCGMSALALAPSASNGPRAHPAAGRWPSSRDLARAKRIRLQRHPARRTRDLEVVDGEAPGVLHGLPAPDAVFVGGGASIEMID